MTKRRNRCKSHDELSQLWQLLFNTTQLVDRATTQPILTLKEVAALTRLSVSQVSSRLSSYEQILKASPENPEEAPHNNNNTKEDLTWITEQQTLHS